MHAEPAAAVLRFNRLCAAAGLVLLLSAVTVTHLVRRSTQDFPQYYMAALVARQGMWESLYPQPIPGSRFNPGWGDESAERLGYAKLARENGIAADQPRFIQAPPVAVALMPLAWLDFNTAEFLWRISMVAAAWYCALLAARGFTLCVGQPTRLAGAILLLGALSPLAFRAARVGNVSPLVAMCLGVVTFNLLRQTSGGWTAAAAMVVGFFAKYATPVLLPIHIAVRRWRVPMWSAAIGAAVLLATLLITGVQPFQTFLRDIAPALGRSHPSARNQALQGLLLRVGGHEVLSAEAAAALRAAQVLSAAVLLWLTFRQRGDAWNRPAVMLAAAGGWVAWLLIFGPLCWEHYAIYLVPMWGWLVWEATQSRSRAVAAVLAIALVWVPWPAVMGVNLPEPVASHMLWSTLIVMLLAVRRLSQRTA